MPFSKDSATIVSGFGEELRDRLLFGREAMGGPRRDDGTHHPETEGPAARESAGAGGRADRACAKVGEFDTGSNKTVEVGGDGGFAAVESGIGVAEVVSEDDDDVGKRECRRDEREEENQFHGDAASGKISGGLSHDQLEMISGRQSNRSPELSGGNPHVACRFRAVFFSLRWTKLDVGQVVIPFE